MSIRAKRKRGRMKALHDYYRTSAWYARRDAIRKRALGRCEFCRMRPMEHVHHRTYDNFGHEPLSDLMSVCKPCHRTIHRLVRWKKPLACAPGSLMALQDRGMGHTPLWIQYLARRKTLAA